MATGGEALSHITWSLVTKKISSWIFEQASGRLSVCLAFVLGKRKELSLGKGKRKRLGGVLRASSLAAPFPEHILSIFLFAHPEFWNLLVVG